MSKRALRYLWATVLVAVLMGLYPPWIERVDVPRLIHTERSVGFGWVLAPPEIPAHWPGMADEVAKFAYLQIDWSRLTLEWLLVGILGTAVALTFRFAKP